MHCSTTHCSTLQHTATHCSALRGVPRFFFFVLFFVVFFAFFSLALSLQTASLKNEKKIHISAQMHFQQMYDFFLRGSKNTIRIFKCFCVCICVFLLSLSGSKNTNCIFKYSCTCSSAMCVCVCVNKCANQCVK